MIHSSFSQRKCIRPKFILCVTGSCQMPVQSEQPTYQTCAVMGGAQLANGNLMNLGKAQFTFKPPNCSYSSKPREHPRPCDMHDLTSMFLQLRFRDLRV